MKLVVTESESLRLTAYLRNATDMTTAAIGHVEVMRHALRSDSEALDRAELVLGEIALIKETDDIFGLASRLHPPTLRTLDAIHIASAMTLEDELEALVTYDVRMQDAAVALGIPVASPS